MLETKLPSFVNWWSIIKLKAQVFAAAMRPCGHTATRVVDINFICGYATQRDYNVKTSK